jgi:hypothetical protein
LPFATDTYSSVPSVLTPVIFMVWLVLWYMLLSNNQLIVHLDVSILLLLFSFKFTWYAYLVFSPFLVSDKKALPLDYTHGVNSQQGPCDPLSPIKESDNSPLSEFLMFDTKLSNICNQTRCTFCG